MILPTLLLELTWSDIPDAVKYIVGTVIALTSAVGGYKAARKSIINPILVKRKAKQMEQAAVQALFTTVERIETGLNTLVAEVKPNGGSSIKDSINRIDTRVEHIQARVRYQDETNPIAKFELDHLGECTFANDAFCEILHANEGDLLFAQWYAFVDPEDRGNCIRSVKEAIEYKFPIDITARFRAEGDGLVRLRLKASPHIASGAVLRGFFGTVTTVQ
jgi:PAS domain-containing protein